MRVRGVGKEPRDLCIEHGKVKFATEAEAERELALIHQVAESWAAYLPERVYGPDSCGFYHLTSSPKPKKKNRHRQGNRKRV